MTTIEIGRFETPVGTLEVGVHDGALVALRFADGRGSGEELLARYPDAEIVREDDPGEVITVLRRYFAGDVSAIDDLAVDMTGTPFQEAVWKALRTVPAGETVTYGEIARRIGAPRAVRAVGTATGRNPVGIVVPCHRIVPSGGGIGNYGGGVDRKAWLLDHEAKHR